MAVAQAAATGTAGVVEAIVEGQPGDPGQREQQDQEQRAHGVVHDCSARVSWARLGPGANWEEEKRKPIREALLGVGGGGDSGVPAPLHSLAQQVILEHLLRARNCPQSQEDGDELGEVLALGAASPLQAR